MDAGRGGHRLLGRVIKPSESVPSAACAGSNPPGPGRLIGVLLGTLKGIVVAIIVSMIGLASQSAYPRVYVIGRKRGEDVLRPLSPEHGDDETFEGC